MSDGAPVETGSVLGDVTLHVLVDIRVNIVIAVITAALLVKLASLWIRMARGRGGQHSPPSQRGVAGKSKQRGRSLP